MFCCFSTKDCIHVFCNRNSSPGRTVLPADVILFEGILVFYFKEILNMFDLKLFVDMDADMRLAQRGMSCRLRIDTYFRSANKKAQLSLTNPRDACEKFARFT